MILIEGFSSADKTIHQQQICRSGKNTVLNYIFSIFEINRSNCSTSTTGDVEKAMPVNLFNAMDAESAF
ncbi:MAG: hypothetical protein QUS12_13050, partial [Methanosarcina sp.]|nr:hypothetical protein [Methanosarcina sp.]